MKKLSNLLRAHRNLLQHDTTDSPTARQKIRPATSLSDPMLEAIAGGQAVTYASLAGMSELASYTNKAGINVWAYRLKEKLVEDMASRDFSGSMRTEYNRSRYEVHRSLMLAHVLKVKGMGLAAMELWERTYLKARRYSLTMEAYICAQHLCYEYAFRKKKTRHYNMSRNARQLLRSLQAESEASLQYQRLIILLKGKWYVSPAYLPVVRQASHLISRLAAKYRTHDLYSMHYRAKFYLHYAEHDYRSLLEACRKYKHYLLNHKRLQQDSRWAEIALHQVNASISLGNYTAGIRLAEENNEYMRPENPNWFTYQENYFQLLMNAGAYVKAKRLYGEVISSAYRKNMSLQQEDVWKVFLAYLQLALHSFGMISRFKPRWHFSRLTSCKSDKAGLNFLIEAGMLMYMLILPDRSDLEKQGERFRKYVRRYIDKRDMPRHYLFSKMLLVMLRNLHRSPDAIRRAGKKYLERLELSVSPKPHDFEANELIRFEQLWEMLLQLL